VAGASRVSGVLAILGPTEEPASVVISAPSPEDTAPKKKATPERRVAVAASAPEPLASAPEPPRVKPTLATTAPVVAPPPAADDQSGAGPMFARANAARRRGDHAGAIVLYRELLRDHPDAAEASASRVALGRLLLDDGDADGALRAFDAYLKGGDGALREEAMAGRARALGRLGRDGEERVAWASLLQSYPQSIHAERARARLER
jgi:TolA-binding protein